ncbi:probable carboxylesterase 17 [Hevea brasiliensis]|uniref:probable carboxylesterase 17 n=1 Tax=Hevea brasiliensis TaxID=3981 RepID=UPI0025F8769C|nr:probable carboxylesterase 17 [Hevea brasiliensis]
MDPLYFSHILHCCVYNFRPNLTGKMSLVAEAPGYLQAFSDGSVKRFSPETVPSSMQSTNGYKFKDVVIDPSKPITARLFLPESSASRLPVMVYFHGGGFCIGSTTWLGYHHFLGDFSVTSQCVVLSIDYRLAPENRLPIAYDDCYISLEWLSHQVIVDPWLELADLSRVFLSGDSAGGNIAHHVAIRAMKNKVSHVNIKGLLLIHPYFGSEKRTKKEMADGAAGDVEMNDMFWRLSIPEGSNRDYFGCNFEIHDLSAAEWRVFPATVVHVAGLDFLHERGVVYAEFLAKHGVKEVELVEAEGESHVFHVFRPESEATRLLQQQMSKFMNSH